MTVVERQARRFRFLQALYEAAEGRTSAMIDEEKLREALGFSQSQAEEASEFLREKGLIKHKYYNDSRLSITQRGLEEIEKALAAPESPTTYFPPVINVTHVGTMINSQIQQGVTKGSQAQAFGPLSFDLHSWITELRERMPDLELDPDGTAEAEAEIATLEAQSVSPKPKVSIVRESLKSLRTILEGAAGNAAASALLPKLLALISGLTSN